MNGTGLGLTNLGTALSFNRSRAFTLVQSPNPGAKTAGYWSSSIDEIAVNGGRQCCWCVVVEQGININFECLDPVQCEERSTGSALSSMIGGKARLSPLQDTMTLHSPLTRTGRLP